MTRLQVLPESEDYRPQAPIHRGSTPQSTQTSLDNAAQNLRTIRQTYQETNRQFQALVSISARMISPDSQRLIITITGCQAERLGAWMSVEVG